MQGCVKLGKAQTVRFFLGFCWPTPAAGAPNIGVFWDSIKKATTSVAPSITGKRGLAEFHKELIALETVFS